MSLITTLGDKSVDTMTDLYRYFVKLTQKDVQFKPFHNQLSKPEFVTLMKSLVDVALSEWQQQVLGTYVSIAGFKRIVLQDGSSFAVHVSWDVLKDYLEQIAINPDSRSEYDFLPAADTLTDTLFLTDRGYFKLSYLDAINNADGYYVVRPKTTLNPMVTFALNRKGKPLKRFTQEKQKAAIKHTCCSVIVDINVEENKLPINCELAKRQRELTLANRINV